MWTFARWGGAFTPPLVILALHHMSWRLAFVCFGSLGVVWVLFFNRWFRDRPGDHPGVNDAERKLLAEVSGNVTTHVAAPWGTILRSRSLWLLWVQYFCLSFPWYFYITWLPTYLQEYRHQTPEEASHLAILPLLFGGFGSLLCGLVILPQLRRALGTVTMARRTVTTFGFLAAASLLMVSIRTEAVLPAMIIMGLASFANDLDMPPSWSSCMDIGGRFAGTIAGSMNMAGNLAGFTAPWIGGVILDHTHGDWNRFLYVNVGVYLVGAMCWSFIDPVTPLEKS